MPSIFFGGVVQGRDVVWRQVFLLALIVFLGTYLRTEAILETVVAEPIRGDAVGYYAYGFNLREFGVYSSDLSGLLAQKAPVPDAMRPPGYGVAVAALFDRGGLDLGVTHESLASSIRPVLWMQGIVSMLTVFVVFLAARRFLSGTLALICAFLVAASPHLVNANVYLLTESLFTFWLALAFALMIQSPSVRVYVLAGLCLGLANLTRPTLEYLPWVLLGYAVIARSERRHWRSWLGLVAVALLVSFLWKLRNYFVVGQWSDPLLFVNTIHHGFYPGFMFNSDPNSLGIPYKFDPELEPGERDLSVVMAVLWDRFIENPWEYLKWYCFGKPAALMGWSIVPIGESGQALLVSGDIYIYPTPATPYASNPVFIGTYLLMRMASPLMFALAVCMSVAAWLPKVEKLFPGHVRAWRLGAITLLFFFAVHMIGAPFPRYVIPFLPLFYLMALVAVPVLVKGANSLKKAH